MLRAAFTLLAFSLGFGAACYSERLPPPAYRYPCDSDVDCDEGQSCVVGLCEYRCSLATFADDCPQEGSYLACINGLCANGCEVGAEGRCPDLTECIDLSALGIDLSGSSSSPFGGGSSATIGVCGRMCDPSTNPCPADEVCLAGFCTPTCDPAEPDVCGEDLVCLPDLNVCGPVEALGGGLTTSAGSSDSGDASSDAGAESGGTGAG